jgi:hypothetical protein
VGGIPPIDTPAYMQGLRVYIYENTQPLNRWLGSKNGQVIWFLYENLVGSKIPEVVWFR